MSIAIGLNAFLASKVRYAPNKDQIAPFVAPQSDKAAREISLATDVRSSRIAAHKGQIRYRQSNLARGKYHGKF